MNVFIASDEISVLLTSEYDITLQTNAFIASDETVSPRYHTADERVYC